MNISIFGLGYVGAVTAGCLARQGHSVVGVDVHAQKVDAFNQGIPPIVEPGLDELLRDAKSQGRLRATVSCCEALATTDVSLICVGTPSQVDGALDLSFVRQVLAEIGVAARQRGGNHRIVIRSTMLPGSTERLVQATLADLEASGQIEVFLYPEFLRESTAIKDFDQPSLAIVGTRQGASPPADLRRELFGSAVRVLDWAAAEMVKYACNAFHATKIGFANEMGRLGKALGIDSTLVMELLCQDTKLNLSPYYLRPGNPFGGSCLPKDVRALAQQGRSLGVSVPILENLLPSNERHLESLLSVIQRSGSRQIVLLGLAFKLHTDDVRESAMVEVAQQLVGQGFSVRIFDPTLNLAALIGSNKRVVETRVPRLAALLKATVKEALGDEGLIVAAHPCVAIDELRSHLTPRHRILDVNGWPELRGLNVPYEGFCW